ncbi:hypothetical protein HOY82DRAFT_413245 [Tuber indicum]|nr:hypothetical protein HOY82DRAFT_413245 [Tuber indicum]
MRVRGAKVIGVEARMVCARATNSSVTIGQFCFHLFPFVSFLFFFFFFIPLSRCFPFFCFHHHHIHNPTRQEFRTKIGDGFTFAFVSFLVSLRIGCGFECIGGSSALHKGSSLRSVSLVGGGDFHRAASRFLLGASIWNTV